VCWPPLHSGRIPMGNPLAPQESFVLSSRRSPVRIRSGAFRQLPFPAAFWLCEADSVRGEFSTLRLVPTLTGTSGYIFGPEAGARAGPSGWPDRGSLSLDLRSGLRR
jgi:hypothetical protein